MEYLFFLLALICVFIITKWYYYDKGFEHGVKSTNEYLGWSVRNSADWFNNHPAIFGNTLFEIGSQILAYGSFRIGNIRDFVDKEGEKRYHVNTNNYTKPT